MYRRKQLREHYTGRHEAIKKLLLHLSLIKFLLCVDNPLMCVGSVLTCEFKKVIMNQHRPANKSNQGKHKRHRLDPLRKSLTHYLQPKEIQQSHNGRHSAQKLVCRSACLSNSAVLCRKYKVGYRPSRKWERGTVFSKWGLSAPIKKHSFLPCQ